MQSFNENLQLFRCAACQTLNLGETQHFQGQMCGKCWILYMRFTDCPFNKFNFKVGRWTMLKERPIEWCTASPKFSWDSPFNVVKFFLEIVRGWYEKLPNFMLISNLKKTNLFKADEFWFLEEETLLNKIQ